MSGQFVAPARAHQLGICGKIASQGDFLAQGLDVAFVDSWNEWLQAVLAVSGSARRRCIVGTHNDSAQSHSLTIRRSVGVGS